MKAVVVKANGGPEQLHLGTTLKPIVKSRDILIRVHATAINRADTLQRQGKYPPPAGESEILGLEVAGEVVEVADDCKSGFAVGDKVMALLGGGGYAEFAKVHEGSVMLIPSNLTYEQAAAIPETWLTAFQLLTIANTKKDDFVLIHAGASGVGTSAIQLCIQMGAKPLVTVGSPAKLQSCVELGAVGGALYKDSDKPWPEEIKQLTQGRGVQVILDCVGASHATGNLDCIATDGRWVLYATMGGADVEKFPLRLILGKRVQLTGTTLRTRSLDYKADLVKHFSDFALRGFESGLHKPIIHEVLPLASASEGHQKMESNSNTGKIVLKVL